MTSDPFGTADLRDAVLAAWERSPARFREDANTEEDHARGYYRDRVVVELAQNAADAAARLGEPGRLLLRLTADGPGGAALLAANTGTPLDAAGVASLASLRASAKRRTSPAAPAVTGQGPHEQDASDGATPPLVGRFGVGFAAVRSVSDDIQVLSAGGAVGFSLSATLAALDGPAARSPALRAEIEARGGALPVLRLPVALDRLQPPNDGLVPDGFATAVLLRLRDAEAVAAVRAQLEALDDALLLALPALAEITVETPQSSRVLSDVTSRWISVTRSGAVPADVLAERPVEERSASSWSVTWAVPRSGERPPPGVVHAPTPTDEPLTLPALLVASFPLDPSRRHVAPGSLADLVAREAGRALADLAPLVPQPLDLVPAGLPAGRLDDAVRSAALDALRGAPVVAGRVASDAVVLDAEVSPPLVDALSATGLGVVSVDRRHRTAARLLGAATMSLADVVDALPDGLSAPQWWRLYDALEPYADGDRAVREALAGMLVPLADGTTARGPRGLVVTGTGTGTGPGSGAGEDTRGPVDALGGLGLRVVHPRAAHPLLERLGALRADDPRVLALPSVEAAASQVADDLLDTDVDAAAGWPEDLAALCALVTAVAHARPSSAGEPGQPAVPAWVGSLPLPADDGAWRAADELARPGTWAAEHLDLALVEVPDGPGWAPLDRDATRLLGVREHLVVRTVAEHVTGLGAGTADLGDDEAADVPAPGWDEYDEYLTAVLGPDRPVGDLLVVADLDVVHPDSWGAVVDVLVNEPEAREALLTPVRHHGPGAGASALSYTAWFLRDVLRAPFVATAPRPGTRASGLEAVLAEAPPELAGVSDSRVVAALGGIADPDDLEAFLSVADPASWDAFSSGLPGPGTPVVTAVARAVWSALATAAGAGLEMDPLPERLVALQGSVARVVEAEDVVVASAPMWSQVRAVVPVADPALLDAVADALDAAVADASAVTVRASDDPQERAVPEALTQVLGGDRPVPAGWSVHEELVVDGRAVEWWVTTDGSVHVAASQDPEAAAARGIAQAAGRWASRHTVEVVLRDAGRAADAVAEGAWEGRS